MSRLVSVIALAVLWCGLAGGQAPDLSKMDLVLRSVPDGPVLKVNGVNVDRAEFYALYQAELGMAAMRTRQPPTDALRLQTGLHCINLLVQREILRQEAVRRKLAVPEEKVQKSWNAQIEQMKKAISKGGAAAISEEEVLRIAGADKSSAMAELRETLLIEEMREVLAKEKGVKVTEAEVQAVYEKNRESMKRPESVHLQRIYVNTRGADERKKLQAREKIEKALARIKAGESFESVAKSVTDAPDKEQGGDPGIVPLSALPPSYVQQLATMKPGDISGVFADDLGLHIIRLIELVQGGEMPAEEVKPLIYRRLMEEKMEEVVKEFCKSTIEKPGAVEVYLQLDKVLAAHPQAEELRREVLSGGAASNASPASSGSAGRAAGKSGAPKSK